MTGKKISHRATQEELEKIEFVKNKLGHHKDSESIRFIITNFSLSDSLIEITEKLKNESNKLKKWNS